MIVATRPASRPSNTVTQADLICLQPFLGTLQEPAFTPRTRRIGFPTDFVLPSKSTVDLAPMFPSSLLGVTFS